MSVFLCGLTIVSLFEHSKNRINWNGCVETKDSSQKLRRHLQNSIPVTLKGTEKEFSISKKTVRKLKRKTDL